MVSHAPQAPQRHAASPAQDHTDHEFIAMLNSYRDNGGLARAQEVAELLRRRGGGDLSTLANWIVNKKIICFEWQAKIWLPLFQFNRIDMTLRPELRLLLAEFSSGFNAWELALWFAQTNPSLADRTPAVGLIHSL